MESEKRKREDEVFGGIVPTEDTLEYVQRMESAGWYLVTVRTNGSGEEAVTLHLRLQKHGAMHHYQLAGLKPGYGMVSLNLYFIK